MSKELVEAQIDSVPWSIPREDMVNTINAYLDSYPLREEGDAEARAALFAEDFRFEDPVGGAPITDRDALIQMFRFPAELGMTIRMQSQRIIISGDEAISLTASTISMEGQEPAHLDIIQNFAFAEDGRLSRVRIYFDKGCIQS